MNENSKKIIISNFYEKAKRFISEEIKLEQETIDQIISDEPKIFELNERDTRIIRDLIGVYTNGTMEKIARITRKIGNISVQRTQQIVEKSIMYIYATDYKIKTQKAQKQKPIEISLRNSGIENLPLKKEVIEKLKTKGFIKIKDFEDLTKDSFIKACSLLEINDKDKRKLLNYLSEIGITITKKQVIGTKISKTDVSDETYKFLQEHEIYTYEKLKENIYQILNSRQLSANIKEKLETLYNNYMSDETKKNKKSTEETRIYKRLIDKKKYEKNIIEELSEQKKALYKLIDKIILSKRYVSNKSKAIMEIYELIKEIDKKILLINESIEQINDEIKSHTEEIIKR